MLVFAKQKLVLLAVPKTGTTALERALLPHASAAILDPPGLKHVSVSRYRAALEQYKKSNYDASALSDLHFFKNCSSVVSIVSLPKDYKLSYMDLNRLKTHLNSLFPNTTLKRYALVIGASANLSLTTLIVKSVV